MAIQFQELYSWIRRRKIFATLLIIATLGIGIVIGTSVDKRATQRNFWERQTKAKFMRMPNIKKDFIITIFARVKNLSKKQFNEELSKLLSPNSSL